MTKYLYCTECELAFPEDEAYEIEYKERHEFWGAPFIHTYYEDACPSCRSQENIVDADQCIKCSKGIPPDEGKLCSNCDDEIDDLAIEFAKTVRDATPPNRSTILEIFAEKVENIWRKE